MSIKPIPRDPDNGFFTTRDLINDILKRVPTFSGGQWKPTLIDDVIKALTAFGYCTTEPQGWQPMHTAPKDGTEIVLRRANGDKYVARWESCGFIRDGWYSGAGITHCEVRHPVEWYALPGGEA